MALSPMKTINGLEYKLSQVQSNAKAAIDSIIQSLGGVSPGASVEAWNSNRIFTPSPGFGTTTLNSFQSRKVQDSLDVQGYFKSGTVAGSFAYIQLPSGITIDSTKISPTAATTNSGDWIRISTGANINGTTAASFRGVMVPYLSNLTQIYFAFETGSDVLLTENCNSILASGDGLSLRFTIPVKEFA